MKEASTHSGDWRPRGAASALVTGGSRRACGKHFPHWRQPELRRRDRKWEEAAEVVASEAAEAGRSFVF